MQELYTLDAGSQTHRDSVVHVQTLPQATLPIAFEYYNVDLTTARLLKTMTDISKYFYQLTERSATSRFILC